MKTNYRIKRPTAKLVRYHGKGVSWCEQNKIGPLAYDELSQVLQEVEGCPAKTAISAISAISPEIANKLEKSQFLLKLIKSSVTGGRRAPSKNCNFSKNCEKLEKSQLLLKLITTSVRGGTMYKGAKQKLQFLQFLQKLQKIGEIAVIAKINYDKC